MADDWEEQADLPEPIKAVVKSKFDDEDADDEPVAEEWDAEPAPKPAEQPKPVTKGGAKKPNKKEEEKKQKEKEKNQKAADKEAQEKFKNRTAEEIELDKERREREIAEQEESLAASLVSADHKATKVSLNEMPLNTKQEIEAFGAKTVDHLPKQSGMRIAYLKAVMKSVLADPKLAEVNDVRSLVTEIYTKTQQAENAKKKNKTTKGGKKFVKVGDETEDMANGEYDDGADEFI